MRTKRQYKAAVIGCGIIGVLAEADPKRIKPATHAGSFFRHPRIKLVGLCDISTETLKKVSKLFPGVPTFTSAAEMIDCLKPEIVSVATHSDTHYKFVKLATEGGARAIICEKPITRTIKEGKKMIEICKKNKTLLFIDHQRHFDSLIRKAREKIKSLGQIRQASIFYTKGLRHNGIHAIDLLRFFLGKTQWVRGFKNSLTSQKGYENIDGLISFKSGSLGVLQSLNGNEYSIFELYFYGSKGYLGLKNSGFEIEEKRVRDSVYFQGYRELSEPKKWPGRNPRSMMGPMVKHVIACLDGIERPLSRGEDGLAALEVILALKRSAESNGRRVNCEV